MSSLDLSFGSCDCGDCGDCSFGDCGSCEWGSVCCLSLCATASTIDDNDDAEEDIVDTVADVIEDTVDALNDKKKKGSVTIVYPPKRVTMKPPNAPQATDPAVKVDNEILEVTEDTKESENAESKQ